MEGHNYSFHFGYCKTSAIGTLQPSVEELTAYRYGSTCKIIYHFGNIIATVNMRRKKKKYVIKRIREAFQVENRKDMIYRIYNDWIISEMP